MVTFIQNLIDAMPEIPAGSTLSRTIFEDEQVKAVLFSFAEGQELSEHTASKPAILHFVTGEAQLTLGGESRTAQAGTWVHMQPHLAHSIKAKTLLVMLLLLMK
jgi:quercetin dioxygenase-like cupin family protein